MMSQNCSGGTCKCLLDCISYIYNVFISLVNNLSIKTKCLINYLESIVSCLISKSTEIHFHPSNDVKVSQYLLKNQAFEILCEALIVPCHDMV